MNKTLQQICFLSLFVLSGCGLSPLSREKNIRHMVRTDYSFEGPSFRDSASELLGAKFVEGNHI
jgi:hypothetical protein